MTRGTTTAGAKTTPAPPRSLSNLCANMSSFLLQIEGGLSHSSKQPLLARSTKRPGTEAPNSSKNDLLHQLPGTCCAVISGVMSSFSVAEWLRLFRILAIFGKPAAYDASVRDPKNVAVSPP